MTERAESVTTQYAYVFDLIRPEMATNPAAWTPNDLRVYQRHAAYLKQGAEEGIVILAGRSLTPGLAVCIFEAESEDAARAFMEADPFVSGGIMRATLYPFRVAFMRSLPKEIAAGQDV